MPAPQPAAAARLAAAIKQAAKAGANASGAVLGTVIRSTPTLDVELDTGQVIPQCAGPNGLSPGARVVAHYINDGHDVAISPMGDDSWAITKASNVEGWTTLYFTVEQGWSAPHVDDDAGGLVIQMDGIYLVTANTSGGTEPSAYTAAGEAGFGAGHHALREGDVVTLPSGIITVDMRAPYSPAICG